MKPVRVLIVDDMPSMRAIVGQKLRCDPGIEVVGEASDPFEARDLIKMLHPDVITLDIEMPRMSGLEFLEKIMRRRPTPVIMISGLTQAGAADSIKALAMGAFDCVAKPSHGDFGEAFSDLADKVKAAAKAKIRHAPNKPSRAMPLGDFVGNDKIIVIGASTGGVEALLELLSDFPVNCPPTVITQHMPALFTKSFAARLDLTCAPSIQEAHDGALLVPGQVFIAPGGPAHLELHGRGQIRCRLREAPLETGHRPSVDVLFRSAASVFGDRCVGVLLTGMGKDGASGLRAIRDAGGRTLGQDAASCVVHGMPRAALELGAVERELPLARIAATALRFCSVNQRPAG